MPGNYIAKCPERYSPLRKADILKLWRISKGRVLTDGITPHEVRQWDMLEGTYGAKGLAFDSLPLKCLRNSPPPAFHMRAEFERVYLRFHVRKIIDPFGLQIDVPSGWTLQQYWFYCIVRSLTISADICTYPDISHTLWSMEQKEVRDTGIIHVLRVHLNRKLQALGEKIVSVHGRGLQLVSVAA